MAVMFLDISHKTLISFFILLITFHHCQNFVLEGSPTSYAQFRKWYVGINGTFEFEFKTDEANGLLMYTDDGGTFDFFEVKLVEGALRLRYNLGSGASIITVGKNLNDNKWHKVEIVRRFNETKLIVDETISVKPVRGVELNFGNYTSNSYVYIGGVPGWYATKLQLLALPSVYFEPRFRGAVRNLLFADSDGPSKRQEMMESKGVRTNKKDTCEHQDPCQHGGICISTDHGAICDCRFVDFDGSFCEKDRPPSEATFRGSDYLSYERSKVGGDAIVSATDEISLYFKTRQPSGLLFFTGEGEDYLNLAIKDGGIVLTISLGSGTLEKQIKPPKIRFDDNQWHKITIHRKVREITGGSSFCHLAMTVDGVYSERGTTAGTFSMLYSSVMYIGGSENTGHLPGSRIRNNFVGCLRKVEFSADSINLNLIDLARTGNKLINVHGDVQFMCQEVEAADPITFTTKESYLVLPSWDGSRTGHISFKIRTNEPNGLLMYNSGSAGNGGDFFAFELMDGHIFLLLNLGSGATKIKATNRRVDDSQWHKVSLQRSGKNGRVTVDESAADFITPGESNQLDLTGSLLVGGVGTSLDAIAIPADLWSGTLGYGYVGCMRDLVVNGKAIDIAFYARKQDSGSIKPACHALPVQCDSQPCMNGGSCTEGWNRFICDCATTSFIGPTCGKDATTLSFDGNQHVKITMPEVSRTQAEDINLRFHTNRPNGLLMATTTNKTTDRLELALDSGRIRLTVNLGDGEEVTRAGQGLNDNQWHTLRLVRRGSIIELRVDEEPPVMDELSGKHTTLEFTQMHLGAIISGPPASYPSSGGGALTQGYQHFIGHIQHLVFNGNYFIDMARSSPSSNVELTAVFGKKEPVVHHTVTFKSKYTYVGLPQLKSHSAMNLYFQFKTLEPNGLILYNMGKGQDFIAIELVNGHLHFIFNLGDGPRKIQSNTRNALNDNKWHAVTVARPTLNKHTLIVDDMIATVTSQGSNVHLDLEGMLYLGGVAKAMYILLPKVVQSRHGFEGCLASLDLNGDTPEPATDALIPSTLVASGCDGPSTKCNNNACSNRGVCVQQWNSYTCDCDMTSFTGPTCSDESVAYEFGPHHGQLTFNFPADRRPDTKGDLLALAFITRKDSGLLVRIDSGSSNDYLELSIVDGAIFMVYNMGTADHPMEEGGIKVNDGDYHVIRVTRSGANSTIQVDDYNVLTKHPPGKQLMEFNTQSRIQIGGVKNLKGIIERPFEGIITGLVFNGLRVLDLAAEKDARTTVEGDAELIMAIPNLKRMTGPHGSGHTRGEIPQQTTAIGGIDTEELVFSGSGCGAEDDEDCISPVDTGSGDDLITPVYIPPTPKPRKTTTPPSVSTRSPPRQDGGPKPCDDEEECKEGSGSEDVRGLAIPSVITPSVFHPTPPMPTTSTPSTMIVVTHLPGRIPEPDFDSTHGGGGILHRPDTTPPREKDDRYGEGYPDFDLPLPTARGGHVTDHPQPPPPPPPKYDVPRQDVGGSRHPTQGSSNSGGGTSGDGVALVIGIVAGILSVVVLVILLVCKFCVQSEGSYKVDESKNYQFAGGRGSPSLGSGIHGPSYGMGAGSGGMGLGLGPMGLGMGGGADGRGMYGTGSLGYINGQQPQMNGNVKMGGEKACKLPKKKDLKDIKEWYV